MYKFAPWLTIIKHKKAQNVTIYLMVWLHPSSTIISPWPLFQYVLSIIITSHFEVLKNAVKMDLRDDPYHKALHDFNENTGMKTKVIMPITIYKANKRSAWAISKL